MLWVRHLYTRIACLYSIWRLRLALLGFSIQHLYYILTILSGIPMTDSGFDNEGVTFSTVGEEGGAVGIIDCMC